MQFYAFKCKKIKPDPVKDNKRNTLPTKVLEKGDRCDPLTNKIINNLSDCTMQPLLNSDPTHDHNKTK